MVVYNSFEGAGNVKVAEVSSSNHVTTFDLNGRSDPAVSINGSDAYLVTYTSNDAGDLNIRSAHRPPLIANHAPAVSDAPGRGGFSIFSPRT